MARTMPSATPEVGAGQDDLVDGLDRLAGTDRTDVGDRAPERVQDGARMLDVALVAADEDRQRRVRAPSLPPDTGASTIRRPRSRSRAAKSQLPDGAIVEQSMTSVPSRAGSATPSGPNRTASTSGVSETQMTTIGASATAAAGGRCYLHARGRRAPARDRVSDSRP